MAFMLNCLNISLVIFAITVSYKKWLVSFKRQILYFTVRTNEAVLKNTKKTDLSQTIFLHELRLTIWTFTVFCLFFISLLLIESSNNSIEHFAISGNETLTVVRGGDMYWDIYELSNPITEISSGILSPYSLLPCMLR